MVGGRNTETGAGILTSMLHQTPQKIQTDAQNHKRASCMSTKSSLAVLLKPRSLKDLLGVGVLVCGRTWDDEGERRRPPVSALDRERIEVRHSPHRMMIKTKSDH